MTGGRTMRYWLGILCLLGLTSCYQYKPPPPEYLGVEFDPRNTNDLDQQLDLVEVLTLGQAKKIAVENNQSYQAALHSVNAARMRYYQALGAYAPQISMGVNTGGVAAWGTGLINPPSSVAGRETAFVNTANVSASWLLFDGFARYLNVRISSADVRKETALDAKEQCMLKRSVAYAFFDYQYAVELMRIHQDDADFQKKLYDIVTPEYEKGKRRQDESLNFRIQMRTAMSSRIGAENSRNIANYSLSQLMGYSRGVLPRSLHFPEFPDTLPRIYYSNDNCIDIALNNNPELRVMRELLSISEFNTWKSYSAFFPTVYADFNYINDRFAANYRKYHTNYSAYTQNTLNYGIRAEWMIFNGLARYNYVREMKALQAVSQFNLAQTYLNTVNAVNAAYSAYDTSYRQYELYRKIVPDARLERDLYEALYLNYHGSVDRIDKVQSYYVDAQLQLVACATEYRKAIAQLEALMMLDLFAD